MTLIFNRRLLYVSRWLFVPVPFSFRHHGKAVTHRWRISA